MGQKVNPHGLRVGVINDWDSRWYAEADFADNLVEDYQIRTYLKKKLYSAGVAKIEIERASDRLKVIIFTAKPGVVIGKGGAEIEKLKVEIQKFTTKKLNVEIKEIKKPMEDLKTTVENHENAISKHAKEIKEIEESQKIICKSIMVMINHELTGNDVVNMKNMRDELQSYLIDK